MRKRFRSWLSSLLVVLLLVLSVAPAMAATPPLSSDEAIALLQVYGLVKGDTNGDFRLADPITRAEAATVFVRAMGAEDLADMMKDAVPFADTKGHWAAGYVTLSHRMGHMNGRDEATFDPQAKITNAEVLTVLLRMVGREPAGPWNAMAIMQAADQLGLAPEGPAELLANLPATRGSMFRSLAVAVFTVPTSDGKTIAQKNLDGDAPVLEITAPATTAEEKVTISGTVSDRSPVTVTVNGLGAAVVGGKFSATVSVKVGANTVTVVAKDVAGNETTKTATVSRGGEVASIEVTGPTTVEAGKSAQLTVLAKDASGRTLPASLVTATASPNLGVYDPATSTFKAGNTPGTAQLTFQGGSATEQHVINVLGKATNANALRIRPVNGGQAPTVGKATTVAVEVVDQDGNAITYDSGRKVTLKTNGLEGVGILNTEAATVAGVATFTIVSSAVGEADLVATSQDLTNGAASVSFTTSTRVVLTATPNSGTADGTTPSIIRASLQDEDGNNVINESGSDILIDLSIDSSSSILSGSSMVIRKGSSTSLGNDSTVVPGFSTERVTVSGRIAGEQPYSVVSTSISFKEQPIGNASKLIISGAYGNNKPNEELTLRVRVTDSNDNLITTGSYAFQLKVSTSNGEDLVNGLPDGLSVSLGSSSLTPVANADGAVVGRTIDGTAELKLEYNKSGQVNIQVVTVTSTDEAIGDDGEPGKASSSKSLNTETRTLTFVGTPAGLRVVVDLPNAKLENQNVGVLSANGSAFAKVKVYVVDSEGGWIPNIRSGKAKLEKAVGTGEGTRLTGTSDGTADFKEGVAEFTIAANRVADIDEWQASAAALLPGLTPLPTVTIVTATAKPDQPDVISMMGEEGDLNRVTVDDDYLEINFTGLTGPYAADTYGYVKVYRSGSSTAIYTSDVIALSGTPFIRVPKSALPDNAETYTITVHNGYGESAKSFAWPQDGTKVTNERPLTVDITGVQYDAEDNKLVIRVSGLSSAEVDSTRLTVVNSQLKEEYSLSTADCTMSSTTITCTDVYLNAAAFQGTAVLMTKSGWLTKASTGQTAEADEDLSDNLVGPMAYISHAVVSFETDSHVPAHVTGTVTLYGKNLNKGRVILENLYFDDDKTLNLKGTSTSITPSSATSVTINLPTYHNTGNPQEETKSVAYRLKEGGSADTTLTADVGWLDSSGYANGDILDIPVYEKVNITAIAYDADKDQLVFTASRGGLAGGTVNLDGLVIKPRNGAEIVTLNSVTNSVVGGNTLTADREFRVQLSAAQASALKKTDPADAADINYSGLVFLSSVPNDQNTNTYWFQTANGFYATELSHGVYKLKW